MPYLPGDSQIILPSWWLLCEHLWPTPPCWHICVANQASPLKLTASAQPQRPSVSNGMKGLVTCVALQLHSQYLSLHSSHEDYTGDEAALLCLPGYRCLCQHILCISHIQNCCGEQRQPHMHQDTVMESKGSSVCIKIELFSYLGNNGEDLGWPLRYSDHFIQGPQQLHKEGKVHGGCTKRWFFLVSMSRILL